MFVCADAAAVECGFANFVYGSLSIVDVVLGNFSAQQFITVVFFCICFISRIPVGISFDQYRV